MKVDLGSMLGVWVCDLEDELGEPNRTLRRNTTPLSTSNFLYCEPVHERHTFHALGWHSMKSSA